MVRGGAVRKTSYSVASTRITELRDLLLGVGFTSVEAIGHDGKPLTLEQADDRHRDSLRRASSVARA